MATPFQPGGNAGVTNTAIFVRQGPVRLFSIGIYNPAAAATFVQLFDTLAAPTVGTTVPILQFGLNTLTARDVVAPPDGWLFQNGLWIAASTTAGGAVAPATAVNVDLGFGGS